MTSNATMLVEDNTYQETIEILFKEISDVKNYELTTEEDEILTRLDLVYQTLKNRIETTDPLLIPNSTIMEINNYTKQISSELSAYNNDEISDGEAVLSKETIELLIELTDKVIIEINNLVQPLAPKEAEYLKESIVSARNSASQHSRYIKESHNRFVNNSKAIYQDVDNMKEQITSVKDVIEEMHEDALSKLKSAENEWDENLAEQRNMIQDNKKHVENELKHMEKRFDDVIQSFQEKIDIKQTELDHAYEEYQKKLNSENDKVVQENEDRLKDIEKLFLGQEKKVEQNVTKLINNIQKDLDTQSADMEEKFRQKITSVEEKYDKHVEESDLNLKNYEDKIMEAEKELNTLIEVAGNRVMSDGYAKYANKANVSKWFWQILSLISFIALISVAYSIIPSLEQVGFNWSVLFARSIITASVGALTAFTIRQAHLSYQEEKENRDMQLKLGSIEPYLKNFPPEKRNEIKEQLVHDYFANEDRQEDEDFGKEVE